MDYKNFFTLIPGLHSEALLKELERKLFDESEIISSYHPEQKNSIRILTTKANDIVIQSDSCISGYDYYIVQQFTSNPLTELSVLCMLSEHLKRNLAHSVTVIAPLFKLGWTQTESDSWNFTTSVNMFTSLLSSCGIDRIVTFTPPPALCSAYYPIPIIVPDYFDGLKNLLDASHPLDYIVYCYEPHLTQRASKLATFLNCSFHMHNNLVDFSSLKALFTSKKVLIYTDGPYSPHLTQVAYRIKDAGAFEVIIMHPCLDAPEQLDDFDYNQIDSVIHLRGLSKNRLPLYFTQRIDDCEILKDWILADRKEIEIPPR